MKKYYDLPKSRLVAMLDWKPGYGSIEQAQQYFKEECREITKKEYDELGEEYSK